MDFPPKDFQQLYILINIQPATWFYDLQHKIIDKNRL